LVRLTSFRLLVVSCISFFAASYLLADESASVPSTEQERESYSIGYQVGLSMKSDGVEVDFEKLIQGLRDATNGKEPLLSDEEMKALIVNRKKEAREIQMKKIQEQRVKNGEESEKFLEENKKKKGVKTTESGLQYKVLIEGKGSTPRAEDAVTVNYRGMFIDGKEFDSSYARGEPMTTKTDGVIKGWTEALQMMKEGSKWQIFVPPQLAYGINGLGTRIPPNKLLVFEIELLEVKKEEE